MTSLLPVAQQEDQDQHWRMQEILQARRLLLVQYACRLAPRSAAFQWPTAQTLLRAQCYVEQDLQQAHADTSYEKTFLKEIIRRVETAIDEVPDDGEEWEVEPTLLERYAELMALPSGARDLEADPMNRMAGSLPFRTHAPPPERLVSYYFPLQHAQTFCDSGDNLLAGWDRVQLREASSALVGAGSTACKTWEASLRLASFLLLEEQRLKLVRPGTKVLELGAGTALVSAMIAKLQAAYRAKSEQMHSHAPEHRDPQVYATDLPSIVSSRIRNTINLNADICRPGSSLCLYDVDWTDIQRRIEEGATTVQPLEHIAPDLILGADIVFDPDLCSPLATVIRYSLAAGKRRLAQENLDGADRRAEAMITSTVRNLSTYSRFLACIDAAGLKSEEVKLERSSYRSGQGQSNALAILPFPSDHDEKTGGSVRCLRIWIDDEDAL